MQDSLWKAVTARAPLAFRGGRGDGGAAPLGPAESAPQLAGKGPSTVTLTGEPMELLLYLFGRREHARVDLGGDADAVAAARAALALGLSGAAADVSAARDPS